MLPSRFICWIFILSAPLARAADAVPSAPTFATSAPDLGSSALSMVFGLIVVLALLIGALWLMKRLSQPHGSAAGLMRVVAGVAVGPRERVVILELGGSWLVLGVAPGQVTTLAEIPRQELPPGAQLPTAEFPAWLKKIIESRGKQ
ncbi:MAG: flagellar biosynthetic protein FliO [Rhodocyclaceae bacterium]